MAQQGTTGSPEIHGQLPGAHIVSIVATLGHVVFRTQVDDVAPGIATARRTGNFEGAEFKGAVGLTETGYGCGGPLVSTDPSLCCSYQSTSGRAIGEGHIDASRSSDEGISDEG